MSTKKIDMSDKDLIQLFCWCG